MRQFNRFKVGGSYYKIVFVTDHENMGCCDVDRHVIALDVDALKLNTSTTLITVFHEVAHAVAAHLCLDPKIKEGEIVDEFEKIIDLSAKGLLMLMTDNLKFFEWVISELKKEASWQGKKAKKKSRRGSKS